MYTSRQLNRQHAGLAAQIIVDEKLSVLMRLSANIN